MKRATILAPLVGNTFHITLRTHRTVLFTGGEVLEMYRKHRLTSICSLTLTISWNKNWESFRLRSTRQSVPTRSEEKVKEKTHVKEALKICGYPNRALTKSNKKVATKRQYNNVKRKSVDVPYVMEFVIHMYCLPMGICCTYVFQ